ncbi:acyl-CoA dehydrogenase C-terminal domain-containing protein [Aliikangiella sp. G2MR2-5]|uniref:acyl-CoA dehydrogenase C-terminal domain-containing protein n=1 Tax=Aliikangiella sp. G2MR2-5 TaxID=2788943 RepID=UPI0018A8DF82|nr:acyl-CoA dehydrogenase C-terminal domain-containing protein [Aliikangiella sp. G2MR2-5]
MPKYIAPLEDMQFILHDCLNICEHYQKLGFEDAADKSMVNAILEESGKFASEVLSPLNYPGDEQGCKLENGAVTTPTGFAEAYKQYCEAGWGALAFDPDFGGQGLPHSLSVVTAEMNTSANTSWSMYPGLTHGAINALSHHGTDELKQRYLPKLISGEWTGTMCLTEAHCGSDLGLLRTKAIPKEDGSYAITGTKIFISAGEHDMSENIIHLVLARLPDAPEGSAGISLFVVPKIMNLETAEGKTDNQVTCSAIEHKMGIKASATCVINFEDSIGYLVGPPNKGLACMFTMMNTARLATSVQGYAIAELSLQGSLEYAKDRLQMRSLSGVKAPDKPADPIIVHPDVKRMLFTQKALVEGNRGLAYYTASLVDSVESGNDNDGQVEARLGLLTPICKAFMTETGFECTNHGVQVFGGHGFICESEMEQQVRDCRISLIYEGTSGIQALDFLGRKVLRDKGAALVSWVSEIKQQAALVNDELKPYAETLLRYCDEWLGLTQQIGAKAQQDMDEVGAAAFDFLMYSGYLSVAHILLQQAQVVTGSDKSESFKKAKRQTLKFYFARLLPRIKTHKASLLSGNETLQCEDFEL